jgi:hypothetical protein
MSTREVIHGLVDELPEELLAEAERRLAALRDDALLRFFLTVPVDDEPLTARELALIEEGEAEVSRGEAIPWELVRDELYSDAECPGES